MSEHLVNRVFRVFARRRVRCIEGLLRARVWRADPPGGGVGLILLETATGR